MFESWSCLFSLSAEISAWRRFLLNSLGEIMTNLVFLSLIGRQLCQHVVGMNPTSVGDLDNPDSWPSLKNDEAKETDEVSEEAFIGTTETAMIHQPFLLDTDRLVRDILLEVGLNIKGFVRYEVGQNHG